MLFKLALGNIRRSFTNYWAYFLSSAFSVFVFYLFLSVVYGKNAGGSVMFQSTSVLFGIGAVLAAMFAAFFIWYSNSFFIKSRKKEFATYMLLGMSKRQTMRLSFLESFGILALAYATGIVAGILLDKFLIMLLYATMQVQVAVPFEINLQALSICSYVYGGVFILVLVHSAWLLRKNNLIELINASRKSEKGMKVSPFTYVVGLLAVFFLGSGYFLAFSQGLQIILWPVVVLFVCIGTTLLFTGLATLFFHFARRNEASLYRGTRLVTVSQLMHRYRGNVGALSVIAITTSVALCAVLTCCGVFGKTAESTRTMHPFSVQYASSTQSDEIFNETVKAHPEIAVASRTDIKLKDARVTVGSGGKDDYSVYLISQTDYNNAQKALGHADLANLPDDNSCLYLQFFQNYSDKAPLAEFMFKQLAVSAGGSELSLTVEQTSTRLFYSINSYVRTIVVRDGVYQNLRGAGVVELGLTGYMLQNDLVAGGFVGELLPKMNAQDEKMQQDISNMGNGAARKKEFGKTDAYYTSYEDSLKALGVLMFVGVFIGLLFIAATGSILYFRMAMEATEDREKFALLLKIGMSVKELRAAVAKELAIVFGAPLVVAAANAFFASFPMEKVVGIGMKDIYFMVLAVYALLYGAYYLLALNKYIKTVRGHL